MTVSLDEETAETVLTVLKANKDASDKRSGIYWGDGAAEKIEHAREQVAAQMDQ
jgi:hypothetical protein